MSSNTIQRTATANMYDSTIRNLGARQGTLTNLQENLTSGKRVVRASDDPVAAAQAERALTRISRIQAEQRALDTQRNAIAQAESTLGDAVGVVQSMRELVVNAGGGTLKPEDRTTIANQLQSLREQLTDIVNRKDTNGVPLLGALGSQLTAFLGPLSGGPDYLFNGQPGQNASTGTSIASTLDGHAAFMFDPQRDGVFEAAISNANPAYPLNGRQFTTSAVTVTNPQQLQEPAPPAAPYTYSVTFSGVTTNPDGTFNATYDITSTNPAYTSPGPQTVSNLTPGKASSIPVSITDPGGATLGFSISALATKDPVSGATVLSPAPGDTVTLSASASMLSTLDSAIKGIGGAANNNAAAQAVGQALANIDAGLERIHNMRGYAGELLNRADRITGDQDNRSIQLEADRSRAEDLDMVKGISDFQNAQVGYQAALQSYAMVQKLSLFNFMS
ncbi:flagellar hook-associated protein FlgL [Alicycliphilus sp. T452]|jgi:flagellar hook-associated protein 3 FlgL